MFPFDRELGDFRINGSGICLSFIEFQLLKGKHLSEALKFICQPITSSVGENFFFLVFWFFSWRREYALERFSWVSRVC